MTQRCLGPEICGDPFLDDFNFSGRFQFMENPTSMADVLPILVVETDENLVVELIRRHVERGHVWRELE